MDDLGMKVGLGQQQGRERLNHFAGSRCVSSDRDARQQATITTKEHRQRRAEYQALCDVAAYDAHTQSADVQLLLAEAGGHGDAVQVVLEAAFGACTRRRCKAPRHPGMRRASLQCAPIPARAAGRRQASPNPKP